MADADVGLPPLTPDIAAALESIGLHEPDRTDPLHVRLVKALNRTRQAPWGDQLVALKFEFNWAQYQAGKEYADAELYYRHQLDLRTVALTTPADGSKGLTRALAEQTVRAQDDMYELQLKAMVAEKREQSLRKFLDTLQSALENERTNRADARAGDLHHARSGT